MSEDILIGWAARDITPERPVMLAGQYRVRVSKVVRDPLIATALALDSGDDQCVMVSCDLVTIHTEILNEVREKVKAAVPDIEGRKILMNATHTHTGPVTAGDRYPDQGPPVMRPSEYAGFLTDRVAEAVAEAWKSRRPGGISRAFSHAVVGHNRRARYLDGHAQMYGQTNREDFDCVEGYEDHSVDLLFTWDSERTQTGIVVNLACPSQVTEHLEDQVSADFWHETRQELRGRFGNDLFVLPQCAAAGDQSPHLLLYKEQEAYMRGEDIERLTAQAEPHNPLVVSLSERDEIGRRIANAVEYALRIAKKGIQTDVLLRHLTKDIELPPRKITEEEAARARAECEELKAQAPEAGSLEAGKLRRQEQLLERYAQRDQEEPSRMELHVIRVGDVALATNPFELFLDYGLRVKARSVAPQTFLVQLACGSGGYLPTERAVRGGGYGAEAFSNRVGPEGGQQLVEETLRCIKALWGEQDG